jgi:PilZ domain
VTENLLTDVQRATSIASQDRRRESRAPLEFPIEVSGFDRFGRFHTEHTNTHDVSLMGCSFRMHMEVEKSAVLALRVVHPKDTREAGSGTVLFHIVRVKRRRDVYDVGVMRLAPGNPWIDYCEEPENFSPSEV